MAEQYTDHVKDNESGKFSPDLLNKATVRVNKAWDINTAFSLLRDQIGLSGFRYYTQREDESYYYIEFFNANDEYIGGIRASKTEKKAELFYPSLLVDNDPSERLLVEAGIGLLI